MARRTHVEMTDDIDGSDATTTITLGLDGALWELDLSDYNVLELQHTLAPWIAAARRTRGTAPRRKGAGRHSREQLDAMRSWARSNGYEVSDRGRIPVPVQTAFENAHRRG